MTGPSIVLWPGGPRSEQLIRAAYAEEGLTCPTIDERIEPTKLLYPRSFVDRVEAMPGTKLYDYAFIGGLYRAETFRTRSWILDFARHRFTDDSYLLITDGRAQHEPLGTFDRTTVVDDVYVPKDQPRDARGFFHEHYFGVLRATRFALCPAGDLPWSMRFFEAILAHSIPIVSDPAHVGRNALERSIGYRVLLREDDHVYDEDVADENFRLFLAHHTLIGGPPL